MLLEIAADSLRQPLPPQFRDDIRRHALDHALLLFRHVRAVVGRQEILHQFRVQSQDREPAQEAEAPLVERHVAPVQQADGVHGVADELTDCQLRRARLAVPEAAAVVVRTGLGHQQELRGQPLAADVLRVVREPVPDPADLAGSVVPDFAVHGLGQRALRNGQPLPDREDAVLGADLLPKVVRGAEYAVPGTAHRRDERALQAHEFPRQLRTGALQQEGLAPADGFLAGEEEDEARLEIVIPRDLVIEAETLRPAPAEPRGQLRQQVRELLPQHGQAVLLPEGARDLKSLHRSPPRSAAASPP